jgi:hypothetical protein
MDMPQYSITISRYSLFVTETTNKKIYSLETKLKNINLIFGHKLHIGMSYYGKRFWTRQIPTSCLPTFIHIEHICRGIISELSSQFILF